MGIESSLNSGLVFYVKSGDLYYTGGFDRSLPPDPYLGTVDEALEFETWISAVEWAESYGLKSSQVLSSSEIPEVDFWKGEHHKTREPKKNEIVRLKTDSKEYKVLSYCLGLVSLRENVKRSRNKKEVGLNEIEYTEAETLSGDEKKEILNRLVEERALSSAYIREISILSKMWAKFPHKEFWIEGFKPALKVSSLSYWYNRPEVEQLYKNWAIDLTRKTEEIVLEKEKIGPDLLVAHRRPKNLLELLG